MKAKLLMILGALLFILPINGSITTHHKKRQIKIYKETSRSKVTTRVPIDYTIEVTGDENYLQIVFPFPLYEADITVTDKDGNVVIEENQTNSYEGKVLYVHSPKAYPYNVSSG
ncbi:DUF3244 domain-containing protein [Bacteroides sp. KH569_7]|uniref:DUF3244 domain-containing protein n=1 Tax=Bacteroides muris (ex Fokt et al. 2023) TaxID=2937417 RepID=A0A9X2NYA4_9BACE|nr:DUF3244 domain-containing protein [Bacteroides muris (ex Fokt et al. 2023)]MCR6507582.1 DUF3244 domain-containing protein [Bacteroides muris (ex Fokt et al. 2023)]